MHGSRPLRVTGRTRELVIAIDRGIYWFTHHWVAFFNVMLLLFLLPMLLGPYAMHAGHQQWGRLLHTLYSPTCHQLPERSFFLFGEKLSYSWDELVAAGMDPQAPPHERRRFLGNPQIGYKILVCQRDVIIYAAILIFGILYGLVGRSRLRPLPFWGFLLFLVPLALDGISQAAGIRESTPFWRAITGLCVGAGSVWFAYPHIENAMLDLRRELAMKLHIDG